MKETPTELYTYLHALLQLFCTSSCRLSTQYCKVLFYQRVIHTVPLSGFLTGHPHSAVSVLSVGHPHSTTISRSSTQ